MNNKIVGVLAGMGPRSTAPFVNQLIDECQRQYGAKNDIDFPHILIYSLPTPFYLDKPIDHREMRNIIINGLKKLESADANFIAMPCNIAHMYYEDLQKSIKIPLLNIVDETIKKIGTQSQEKVTFLATPTTYESTIYQTGLTNQGIHYLIKEHWKEETKQIIALIKANTLVQATKKWEKLLAEIQNEGITTIIVACTDLSVLQLKTQKVSCIDSSQCLAEATIKKYLTELL